MSLNCIEWLICLCGNLIDVMLEFVVECILRNFSFVDFGYVCIDCVCKNVVDFLYGKVEV